MFETNPICFDLCFDSTMRHIVLHSINTYIYIYILYMIHSYIILYVSMSFIDILCFYLFTTVLGCCRNPSPAASQVLVSPVTSGGSWRRGQYFGDLLRFNPPKS